MPAHNPSIYQWKSPAGPYKRSQRRSPLPGCEEGENGRKNIIITEIPNTISGNKAKLVETLVNLAREKVFDEIYDVRDESSKEGIRIVVEVKKDRDINNLLNGLYKKTQMEDTYGVNLLAIKPESDGTSQPKVFNLKSMIEEFVLFQEDL